MAFTIKTLDSLDLLKIKHDQMHSDWAHLFDQSERNNTKAKRTRMNLLKIMKSDAMNKKAYHKDCISMYDDIEKLMEKNIGEEYEFILLHRVPS